MPTNQHQIDTLISDFKSLVGTIKKESDPVVCRSLDAVLDKYSSDAATYNDMTLCVVHTSALCLALFHALDVKKSRKDYRLS